MMGMAVALWLAASWQPYFHVQLPKRYLIGLRSTVNFSIISESFFGYLKAFANSRDNQPLQAASS
jgi:hypothetical protein